MGNTTPTIRFSVEKVFDLPTRGGLLASGRVLAGAISQGMVLQDETTGAQTTVLALDFLTPTAQESGRMTLVLERTDPSPVTEGRVLIARPDPRSQPGRASVLARWFALDLDVLHNGGDVPLTLDSV